MPQIELGEHDVDPREHRPVLPAVKLDEGGAVGGGEFDGAFAPRSNPVAHAPWSARDQIIFAVARLAVLLSAGADADQARFAPV
eukprot:CAMPEP_0177701442 /NCGR_PEP_ID=MMETSP0484_2-20121128/6613_1 /TAXON_ID=354590 /ORGANISM="Rhodomonas lens, Strain RHODO" /LENGTH=83 /DNA_ID=CAMNT_0019212675 /DNA_START=505 /DNA_END=757 /DNA_ORIENTATION=-